MSAVHTHPEKFYINKTIGPVKTPYVYKEKNYEIVFPKRVNAHSEHLTYAMKHHYNENKDEPDPEMHLMIPIQGRNHHIHLRPSRKIFSPGMIIETFKHPRKSHLQLPDAKINRRCHYTGRIRGHPKTRAALSTCNGVVSRIFAFCRPEKCQKMWKIFLKVRLPPNWKRIIHDRAEI